MSNVVYLQVSRQEPEPFDSIAWLRKELEKPHPQHRVEFMQKRIRHLEAQAKET